MSGLWLPESAGSDPTGIDIRFDPRSHRMEGIAVHGDTPFSVPYISQIDDTLWQGGCTSGLILPGEIVHVVSLYPWEQYVVRHELRSMFAVRLYDSDDEPDARALELLAAWVNRCRADGPTLVHCQAGLNRSALVAGLALIRGGLDPETAIALMREKRSPAVLCNRTFEAWLRIQANPVQEAA